MKRYIPIIMIICSGCVSLPNNQISCISPDKKLMTSIIDKDGESIIEIRDSSYNLIAKNDFTSKDHSHGWSICSFKWSPDSRFFIFTTSSSGGHGAWHFPIYCYSDKWKKIISLDYLFSPSSPVINPEIFFLTPSILRMKVADYRKGSNNVPTIEKRVDLNKIIYK